MTSFGIFLTITILIAVFVVGAAIWSYFNPSTQKRDYEHNTGWFKKNDFNETTSDRKSDDKKNNG